MKYQDTTTQQPVTREPTRYSDKQFLHTTGAGAMLPLIQSAITAGVMMVLTATVIYLFNGYDYIKWMLVIGAFSFAAMWIGMQFRWINLTRLEQITHMELDGRAPYKGKPEPRSLRVQLDHVKENGHIEQSGLYDFTGYADEQQLYKFAYGILVERRGLAETEWSGAGKPFSIKPYIRFRDLMITRGLVVAANSKSLRLGFIMTVAGKAVLRRILDAGDPTTSPPPPQE